MDVETLKRFNMVGARPDDAIYRFLGKEEIYKKFLKKYLNDAGFEAVCRGVEHKESYEIFKAAHTLKGVAANLGLESVQEKASAITEYTRERRFEELDMERLKGMLDQLEDCNQKVCEIIEEYCQ